MAEPFRWELRRKRDGLLVDRAHRLWILRRAAVASMLTTGAGTSRTYLVVHAATHTAVGRVAGTGVWELDAELARKLEPEGEKW